MTMARMLPAMGGALVWTGLSAGAVGQAASRPATQPAVRLSADRVAELVGQLGHRRWADRDRAAATLKRGGLELLEPLAAGYKTHKACEIRLRIKEVVEHIVMAAEMSRAVGFLGIRQRLLTQIEARRLPEVKVGVAIVEVLRDTAAAAAGLLPGDVVLAVNGQRLEAVDDVNDFPKRIARFGPGAKITLEVLRGDTRLEVHATLQARPPEYTDERSENYVRAQERFRKIWRDRFDPSGVGFGSAGQAPTLPEAIRPDRLIELILPKDE